MSGDMKDLFFIENHGAHLRMFLGQQTGKSAKGVSRAVAASDRIAL
jgi:hypothetical protein